MPPSERTLRAQGDRLRNQTNQGATNRTENLGRMLRQQLRLIARLGGDLSRNVKHSFSAGVSGEVASIREAISAHLDQWRQELSVETASPLECLLIGRLVSNWLASHAIDHGAASHDFAPPIENHRSAAAQDRDPRRRLASAQALAAVRKLTATRQINLSLNAQMTAGRDHSAPRVLNEGDTDSKWIAQAE